MKKILFITNLPSPYRVAFFNEIGKSCDLTVLYERQTADNRNELWKGETAGTYREIYLKGVNVGSEGALCPEVRKYLKDKSYDFVIISGYSTGTSMLSILWMKLHRRKFILNSDGFVDHKESFIKHGLKKLFISAASAILTTSRESIDYLAQYGAKKDKCFVYPLTSFYTSDILPEPPGEQTKQAMRRKLGMTEKNIVISVGRFSYLGGYGKGYDVVMKSADNLRTENIGYYIIGDKPTEEFAEMQKTMKLDKLHFVDFLKPEQLREYYLAADISVLMTVSDVWGLVINESMAYGLPVITTDKCVAGKELIENDINGYVIPVGDDKALTEKTMTILSDNRLKEKMSNENIDKIKGYTFENMAAVHLDILGRIMPQNDFAEIAESSDKVSTV